MVLKESILKVRKLLGKNALLMALVALIFTIMGSFGLNEGYSSVFRFEGFLTLFIIYGGEFAKSSVFIEKISKRIEFLLANGLSLKSIVVSEFLTSYLATAVTLLLSFAYIVYKYGISFLGLINILISTVSLVLILVLYILEEKNMNKISSIQLKSIGYNILVLILSGLGMKIFKGYRGFLFIKFISLFFTILILGKRLDKERIVSSFY